MKYNSICKKHCLSSCQTKFLSNHRFALQFVPLHVSLLKELAGNQFGNLEHEFHHSFIKLELMGDS